MAFPWGAIAGAGASLIGSGLSFLGGQQQMGANASQNAFSNMMAQQQLNFEEAAAQHGISWRVSDAKAAGISPLVALGAPTFNPGAISAGGIGFDNPNAGAGAALSGMGQDLSRAAMAAQTEKTRADAMTAIETARQNGAVAQSETEKNLADAALARKRAEILGMPAMPSAAGGPGFMPGQGSATKLEASKQIAAAPGDPGSESAATPGYKWVANGQGGVRMQPSLGTSEGATGESLGWSLNYRLPQAFGYNKPPASALPPGQEWSFNAFDGHWYPKAIGRNSGTTLGVPDAMPDGRSWYSGGTNTPPY